MTRQCSLCVLALVVGLATLNPGAWSQESSPAPSPPASGASAARPSGIELPAVANESPIAAILSQEASAKNPYVGDWRTRERLTGDWLGARSLLDERGMNFNVALTQYYQNVAAGGNVPGGDYGGKIDYLFAFDSGKLGLWQGFFLKMHAETRYGECVNNHDGLLAPSNLAMQFPAAEGSITSITGFEMFQSLGENLTVFAGKINTLDEYPIHFVGGVLNSGFFNTSLIFNPIVARTIPYSAAGAGFAIRKDGETVFSLTIFDPEERATKGLENLYERGVLFVPDFVFRVKPWGLPGVYNFGGTYSTAEYTSTEPSDWLEIPPGDRGGPVVRGSWSLYCDVYQSLWQDTLNSDRHWGVFGQFGVSDGNPNPIRYVINSGIGGHSPIRGREADLFGIGLFYVGLSNEFKALTATQIPQQNEYGIELFYNLAITPWCRLTADLQFAEPSTKGLDTVVIPGLRLQMLF